MRTMHSIWIFAIILLPAIAIIQNRTGNSGLPGQPYILKGRVMDAQKGKAIAGVHVFVVEGEEEGFSNDRGEFSLKTWSKLPVAVVVKSSHHHTKRLSIKDPGEILDIRLVER